MSGRAGARRLAPETRPFVLRSPAPREAEWQFTAGDDACAWIEEHCLLPSGERMGEPFVLMEWQRDFIRELYRVNGTYELRYRWALLGVPKGNGKTPLIAALALYHLLGDPDEPDPWVVMAAASDKQADNVFAAAATMCTSNPDLAAATEVYRGLIRVRGGPGKIERVAAAKGKLDGKLISMLVADELHEWQRQDWVVLTGGALKRRRAQIIQITTAGFDRESVCYQEYEKGVRLANGEEGNPTYLFAWYGAPEDADLRSPEVWRASNPSWGTLVFEETLADVFRNQPENDFRRYRLNQWVKQQSAWLPVGAWDACNVGPFELEEHARAAGGWDASTRRDSTAVVLAQPRECPAGRQHVRVQGRAWERVMGADGQPDDDWRVPMAEVVQHVRSCFERYDLSDLGMGYDPAFIAWEAADLEAAGLLVVEFPQTPTRMVKASAALFELICVPCECGRPRLEHDGDPVLARHVAGVQARMVRGGGYMIEKRERGARVDLAVALAMAVSLINQYEEDGTNDHGVYEV